MQSAAKHADPESARKLREALRRELVGSLIGGGGEARKSPRQVAPFIDALELAGAEDRIKNRRAPAGVRMADEEEILFPDGAGSDGSFHRIGIDLDVAVAGCGVASQFRPAFARVVYSLEEVALRQDRQRRQRSVNLSSSAQLN